MRLSYRFWVPAICVLAALLLSVSLLHYGTYHWESPQDDLVQKPQLVLSLSQNWMDFGGVCDVKHACAIFTQKGIFARFGVPPLAAILGGLIVPSLLILAALTIATANRWMGIAALCIAAAICAKTFVFFESRFVILHNSVAYDFDQAKVSRVTSNGEFVYNFNVSPLAEMPIAGTTITRDNENMGTISGLYLRGDVSHASGVVIGLFTPALLLLAAIVLVVQTIVMRRRKI